MEPLQSHRPSWRHNRWMLACVCGAYAQSYWRAAMHSDLLGWLTAAGSMVVFAAVFFAAPWPGETVLRVSDDAVQLRSGLLFLRRDARIPLDAVRTVRVRQSPLQRWLRVGSVTVAAYHPPQVLTVYGIASPQRVADEIQRRADRTREASGPVREPVRTRG